ncbi:GNAT family N-acetyltransferase [Bradyrhizobium genosp. A]|uniref:GNAT family N-acetyltransferase n=1 Tax=Bradyrhizobium genosp. A TaxID=83626 RepID=UPI003CF4420D
MASLNPNVLGQVSGETAPLLRADFPLYPYQLRELGAADQIALRDLLLGLDEASRISRFSGVLGDHVIVQHAQYAVTEAAWIAGAFVGNELCGTVELYEARDPLEIEAAFAVAGAWRRQGIGTALLLAALQWAQRSRRARLQMVFSRRNWAMRRLVGKAGASLDLALDEFVASVAVCDWRPFSAAPGADEPLQ